MALFMHEFRYLQDTFFPWPLSQVQGNGRFIIIYKAIKCLYRADIYDVISKITDRMWWTGKITKINRKQILPLLPRNKTL